MEEFDATDEGEMKEYISCKIICDMKERWLKFTQPVLLQSFADEFETRKIQKYKTPMEANKKLEKADPEQSLGAKVKHISVLE